MEFRGLTDNEVEDSRKQHGSNETGEIVDGSSLELNQEKIDNITTSQFNRYPLQNSVFTGYEGDIYSFLLQNSG